jgi:D-alanyl-D-alanine carboxypeptidase/D-alanyl-D-alanine-endopeptidase (penicillin-binding protein 4)
MKFRAISITALMAVMSLVLPAPAQGLDPNSVAGLFQRLTASNFLSNPSVVLIDELTGEVVFEKNAQSLRKPASVLKIYAGVAALTYLNPDQRYSTIVSLGLEPKSLVIRGSLDPWISLDDNVAKKMGRTSLPRIGHNSISQLKAANGGSTKNSTIYYSDLYSQDVANLKAFYKKRGLNPKFKEVDPVTAMAKEGDLILTSQSPTLNSILAFTLTWSDNLLADRIARLASREAGHAPNDAGVAQTFVEVLDGLDIDSANLTVKDASGLSRDNRVTARQVGQLLVKIRNDPKFAPVISGLPVGGVSGTLRNRFSETAPEAVGLVRAKTGTLNGTANLAGYVEAGDREYAFVIIADQLRRSSVASKRARDTVDRILGKLALPFAPQPVVETPVLTES